MVQLHERTLLYPRNVRSRDTELLRNLPLRAFFPAMLQPEPSNHNFLLAVIENIQIFINFAFFDFQLHLLGNVVRIRTQDIDKGNFIAFLVGPDRVVQRDPCGSSSMTGGA